MRISDWSSDVCSSDLPSASASFAETHVRRLEAIRRVTGGVEREPDGTWVIAPDHLERAAAFERRQAQAAPEVVQTLRSEERRVGKGWVSTRRSRWSRDHSKKNI